MRGQIHSPDNDAPSSCALLDKKNEILESQGPSIITITINLLYRGLSRQRRTPHLLYVLKVLCINYYTEDFQDNRTRPNSSPPLYHSHENFIIICFQKFNLIFKIIVAFL
jgi:hypothetical protein